MTALAVALVLIFLLHLIDKHGLWRKAFKITLWLTTCLLALCAIIYGWTRYSEKRESEAYSAKMKPIWDCEARNAKFSNATEECERDPNVVLQPVTLPQSPNRSHSAMPELSPTQYSCSD